jgi:hypothetical protein
MKRTYMKRQSPKAAARAKALAKTKLDLIKRATGRCEYPLCMRRTPLDQHHVIKRSQLKPELADRVDNLVVICRAHHDMTDRPLPRISAMSPLPDWIRGELSIKSMGGESFEFLEFRSDGSVVSSLYVRPS